MTEEEKRKKRFCDVLENIKENKYVPVPSGVPFMDDLVGGGFVPGTVTVIVAEPGAGKTALCQQMAAEMAKTGYGVTFINYEMDDSMLYARDISREAAPDDGNVDSKTGLTAFNILQGKIREKERFSETVERCKIEIFPKLEYNPYIMVNGTERPIRNTIADLKAITDYLISQKKPDAPADVLFLDYIQLVTGGANDSKISILETITGILTDYARRGNTFVFAVSSANRDSRKDTPDGGYGERRDVLIYIDKSRFHIARQVCEAEFVGAASKFYPVDGKPRSRRDDDGNLLEMMSGNGASVLEYSASYFISINHKGDPDAGTGKKTGAKGQKSPKREEIDFRKNKY